MGGRAGAAGSSGDGGRSSESGVEAPATGDLQLSFSASSPARGRGLGVETTSSTGERGGPMCLWSSWMASTNGWCRTPLSHVLLYLHPRWFCSFLFRFESMTSIKKSSSITDCSITLIDDPQCISGIGIPLPLVCMVTYGLMTALSLQENGDELLPGLDDLDIRLTLLVLATSLATASAYFLFILNTKFAGTLVSVYLLHVIFHQTEGAKMYGAFWCTHCNDQKQLFGREAMEILDYVERKWLPNV